MPTSRAIPLKYLPSQLAAISREVELQPGETLKDVRRAFDSQAGQLRDFAKANHLWTDRTHRATSRFNVFTDGGAALGMPPNKDKFYLIMSHSAVDPRNNEAYGWYLENKIYNGASQPYGVLRKLMTYATTVGLNNIWGRVK